MLNNLEYKDGVNSALLGYNRINVVESASSIQQALQQIVRIKHGLLIAAMLLFVVALGMLAGLYVYGVNRG